MIVNLPNSLSVEALLKFDAGSHEAIDDDLLEPCYCPVSAVTEFLRGRKDVLHGSKGSGKTAVFTLLLEGFLNFTNSKGLNQILVPISEDVEYVVVKQRTAQYLQSTLPDEDLRFRFLWEAYILYRVALSIHKQDLLPISLREDLDEFIELFSRSSGKPTIMEFLGGSKVKVSFRLGTENTFVAAPEFSIDPSAIGQSVESEQAHIINLDAIKKELSEVLKAQNSIVYVLVDNIDKFSEREAYKVQRSMVDGLMQAIEGYKGIRNIKVKAFIRTEQYNKTDHASLSGQDKSGPRATELRWSESDIRRLIARRINYNFDAMFGEDNRIQFKYDEDDFYSAKGDDHKGIMLNVCNLVRSIFGETNGSRKDRETSFSDHKAKELITLFMPRNIDHFEVDGEDSSQQIFDWVSTHFQLANGKIVPRTIIVFLENVVRCSIRYYEENDDITLVLKNENDEYPLMTPGSVSKAFGQTQEHVVNGLRTSTTHKPWQRRIAAVFPNGGTKAQLTSSEIKRITKIKNDTELHDFCAYLRHLGALKRLTTDTPRAQEQVYSVPILLQRNWVKENEDVCD